MSDEEAARHRAKMENRKAHQDAKLREKTVEKGLLIVNTGPGKGKSTAPFGLALRLLGYGRRVGIVQFIKGAWHTGERDALARFGDLPAAAAPAASQPTYDINTLAGKVASLNGTAGLQIRFSAFIEEEAEEEDAAAAAPIAPSFVLSSPLDGTTVQAPIVTVNQDTAAAPQNETAIAGRSQ